MKMLKKNPAERLGIHQIAGHSWFDPNTKKLIDNREWVHSFIPNLGNNLGTTTYYDTFENTLLDYKQQEYEVENIQYQINLINTKGHS